MILTGPMAGAFTYLFLYLAMSSAQALDAANHTWQLSAPGQQTMTVSILNGLDEPGALMLNTESENLFQTSLNRSQLLEVCEDKNSHFPSFIITEVLEGVGLEQAYALTKTTGWQLTALGNIEGVSTVNEIVGCSTAESNWTLNGEAITCECDFNEAMKHQWQGEQWLNLLDGFQTGLYFNKSPLRLRPSKLMDTARVEQLLAKARANRTLTLDKTVKGRQWVIIEHINNIYGSFSLGLMKQNKHWFVWYYVMGNSKSFYAINGIALSKSNELSAALCIEGCDWWGKEARVNIHLETLLFTVVERD
jgi:hypothetical protein